MSDGEMMRMLGLPIRGRAYPQPLPEGKGVQYRWFIEALLGNFKLRRDEHLHDETRHPFSTFCSLGRGEEQRCVPCSREETEEVIRIDRSPFI